MENFPASSRRHDPMLVLNMTLFNFTDGWNRAFPGSSMHAFPSSKLLQSMDSAQPGMNAAQEFVVVKAQLNRVYEEWSRIETCRDLSRTSAVTKN